MSLDTKWVVMKVSHRASRYGNIIQEVTFANENWEIAHTYLDENNMNYVRWKDALDLYDRGCGVVLRGLRAKRGKFHKKTKEPLINADSPVNIAYVDLDRNEVLDTLIDLLKVNG